MCLVLFYVSFLAANISDVLKENITKSNYDKPTPIQKWAIPWICYVDIFCENSGHGTPNETN